MAGHQSLKSGKRLRKHAFYYINHENQELFYTFESSFKTGGIFSMKGSRRVSVEVVLFQLRGRGHPQGDATSNIFTDSKSSI